MATGQRFSIKAMPDIVFGLGIEVGRCEHTFTSEQSPITSGFWMVQLKSEFLACLELRIQPIYLTAVYLPIVYVVLKRGG